MNQYDPYILITLSQQRTKIMKNAKNIVFEFKNKLKS